MKKINKISLLLLSSLTLFSCDKEDSDSFEIYKSKFDDGSICQKLYKSETSSEEVYELRLTARNDSKNDVTISTSDFKLKYDNKEYTPLFFTKVTGLIGNLSSTRSYIKESIDSITIKADEATISNILPCFEVEIKSDYSIEYKGIELKSL